MNHNDIMIDILTRLPLKTSLRCRSVCKWWNNLISYPIFMSNYSGRNPHHFIYGFFLQKFLFLKLYPELGFVPCEEEKDFAAQMPSLTFIDDENGVQIQDSCNGILLCSSFRCYEDDQKYYICKPTTKQYLFLPKPECKTLFGVKIVYYPHISSHFKVISICDSKFSANHREIKLYNPAIGASWRVLSGNPINVSDDHMLFNRGVFWNGALHWVGRGDFALRFDVEREMMFTMPMPPTQEGKIERRLGYFGQSGGHLYLVEIYGPLTTIFDVMEMKRDYSGWSVKYHIDLQTLVTWHGLPTMRHNVQEIHRYVFSILYIVDKQA